MNEREPITQTWTVLGVHPLCECGPGVPVAIVTTDGTLTITKTVQWQGTWPDMQAHLADAKDEFVGERAKHTSTT